MHPGNCQIDRRRNSYSIRPTKVLADMGLTNFLSIVPIPILLFKHTMSQVRTKIVSALLYFVTVYTKAKLEK